MGAGEPMSGAPGGTTMEKTRAAMVVRIVKMTFRAGEEERFLELFQGWKPRIRGFPGCRHLELWRDRQDPRIFFTYSHWDGESDLAAYRSSEVFASVWPTVKTLFAAPAEAWSVDKREVMP
jgi:quinol monooxygenase YgiN